MKFSRSFRKLLAAAALVGMATTFTGQPAEAATVDAPLTVQVDVAAACTVTTAAVNFGTYDALGAQATTPLDATGNVAVECATGVAYFVRLGVGNDSLTGDPADPQRQMEHTTLAGNFMPYSLSYVAPGGTEWGDTAATSPAGSVGAGVGATQNWPVFGRIAPAIAAQAGQYSDSVLATAEF
ncbi:MAG: spore coat protein U domain-containing protein [Myxococcales bacterium]|nr:spore coat protein U domain-containing protein [Myxococcales bacterium]